MSTAIQEVLGLLERRAALRVLWALRDGEAQVFRQLRASAGNPSPSTLNTRLHELRAAGMVEHVTSSGYRLTPAGHELAPLLLLLDSWAGRHMVQKN